MKTLLHDLFGRWLTRWQWYRRWQGIPEPNSACAKITAEALAVLEQVMQFHADEADSIRARWLEVCGEGDRKATKH